MNRLERLRELSDANPYTEPGTATKALAGTAELLSLAERLSEVDPFDANGGCVGCKRARPLNGHDPDCLFLLLDRLLEQWKADGE